MGLLINAVEELAKLGRRFSGAEAAARLAGTPTARDIAGAAYVPPGGFFTDISEAARRTALPTHTSTRVAAPELSTPQPMSFEGLLGRDLMSIVGDNSGRHTVLEAGGVTLPNPVKSQAGFEYIDVPGQGYAGAKSAQSAQFGAAQEANDPFYISLMMGEKSSDFARHTGQVYGEMARANPVDPKNVGKIDSLIRDIGVSQKMKVTQPDGSVKEKYVTVRPFSDFPTVADPNAIYDYLMQLPTGTLRASFLKGLDKATLAKLGLPQVKDARLAVADLAQLGMDYGTVGYRGFTPDLARGLHPTTPGQSLTYDTAIDKIGPSYTLLGEGSGGLPANLVFREAAESRRAKGGGQLLFTQQDYKVHEGNPRRSTQMVDRNLSDTLTTFQEIERRFGREAALRYADQILRTGDRSATGLTAARRAVAPNWAVAGATAGGAGAAGLLAQPDQAQAGGLTSEQIRRFEAMRKAGY